MSDVDYTGFGGSASRPQEGRNEIINSSLDSLNTSELNKINRIIDRENNKK